MYKQIIIARKDLKMSPGKLAAQVSHGSMAFLTNKLRAAAIPISTDIGAGLQGRPEYYVSNFTIDADTFEQWIDGEFTKCVLQARNKNQLLKAREMAEDMGLVEGLDFWLIRDNCHTELEPEEAGRTLTVIGFRPMEAEVIDKIGRKYHLYT